MNTMKTRKNTNPLHDLKHSKCTTLDRLQALLFLNIKNGTMSQVGHAIGILPTTAANLLREMANSEQPLVLKIPNTQGMYRLTKYGEKALDRAITFMDLSRRSSSDLSCPAEAVRAIGDQIDGATSSSPS